MLDQKPSLSAFFLVDIHEKCRTAFLPFAVLSVFVFLGMLMLLAYSSVSPNSLFNRKSIKGRGYFTFVLSPKTVCFKSTLSFIANEIRSIESKLISYQFCLYLIKSRSLVLKTRTKLKRETRNFTSETRECKKSKLHCRKRKQITRR